MHLYGEAKKQQTLKPFLHQSIPEQLKQAQTTEAAVSTETTEAAVWPGFAPEQSIPTESTLAVV